MELIGGCLRQNNVVVGVLVTAFLELIRRPLKKFSNLVFLLSSCYVCTRHLSVITKVSGNKRELKMNSRLRCFSLYADVQFFEALYCLNQV